MVHKKEPASRKTLKVKFESSSHSAYIEFSVSACNIKPRALPSPILPLYKQVHVVAYAQVNLNAPLFPAHHTQPIPF